MTGVNVPIPVSLIQWAVRKYGFYCRRGWSYSDWFFETYFVIHFLSSISSRYFVAFWSYGGKTWGGGRVNSPPSGWVKARDTNQTVLESAWNEKNYNSSIDLQFNTAWKSHGALKNDFLVPRDIQCSKFQWCNCEHPTFRTENRLKDMSNVKSIIVGKKGPIEHYFAFLLKWINEFK